jgi:glycosyltransferase involved in cell wall biosynthesis
VLKLLLILPPCDGEDVGEAWFAYQWARHLMKNNDLTVLTYSKRGRTPVSKQLPTVRVAEWVEPPLLGRSERFNSMLKPGYLPFYVRSRRWIRRALSKGEEFDLAFQPVPEAMRYPSPVAGLGVPFIIGPVGGSLTSPPLFRSRDRKTPWYLQLRRLDDFRLRRDPLLRRTFEQASCVLGIGPYVRDRLAGIDVKRFEMMSDTGLERLPAATLRPDRGHPIRLLFVGRLVPTKGARDAIRALSLTRDLPVELDIVGDGFDRDHCVNLASSLGVSDRVRFHGRVPRDQVEPLYRRADVFVFPSYREPGGSVVLEAMSHGLPVVTSDLGGPAYAVDATSGFRLTPTSPDQYAGDIAAAISVLVTKPELRHTLGDGARKRAEEIGLWSSKASQLQSLFEEIACSGQPVQPI